MPFIGNNPIMLANGTISVLLWQLASTCPQVAYANLKYMYLNLKDIQLYIVRHVYQSMCGYYRYILCIVYM